MTEQHFKDLQAAIYYSTMETEWQTLIEQYNKKYEDDLNVNLRCDRIKVLNAIAFRMGFKFEGKDINNYNPDPIKTNQAAREFWNRLYLRYGIKQV